MRSTALVALTVLALEGSNAQAAPPSPPPGAEARQDRKAEFDQKLQEAEGDTKKLWALHQWCESYSLEKEARTVLRKIVKLDEKDKKAHELLGEIEFDGKWFPNQKKVDEYKAKKLEDDAKKQGKVVHNGEIVDPADLEKLKKGLKKLEDGRWVDAEEHKRITEGWVQQDLDWVPPAEAANIDKGLWKCGDAWLSLDEANKYHAQLEKCWKIPSDHFVLFTTCTRELAQKAMIECDRALTQFNRVLGRVPSARVPVLVLKNLEEFNNFAGSRGVELRGFSSIRAANMAEIWPEPFKIGLTTSAAFCYWDPSSNAENTFGPMYVRHAATQALMEALDPSPKTMTAIASGKQANPEEWWKEKQFPEWFRYAACSYVDRWINDQYVNPGGNPKWMWEWSKENLIKRGGLDALDTIFAFELSPDGDKIDKSQHLLNQAGFLMSFILDGKCGPVTKEFMELKDAFRNGKDVKAPMKALESALRANVDALRKFGGI
jgi:hypothetical protein